MLECSSEQIERVPEIQDRDKVKESFDEHLMEMSELLHRFCPSIK
jgi:hypothetical protein